MPLQRRRTFPRMSHSTFVRHFLICGLDTAAGLELDDAGTPSNHFNSFPCPSFAVFNTTFVKEFP